MKPILAVAAIVIMLGPHPVAVAQQPFEVPLMITDGINTRTVYFAILPGADFCIVPTDSFNAHVESMLPPIPPSGAFDVRFVWPRAGSNLNCFGQGSLYDFRPYICIAQRDTFRVRTQPGAGTVMVISWPAGLGAYFGQLTLRYFDGTGNVNVNMLTATSADITAAGSPAIANIFAGNGENWGPMFKPYPPSLDFGSLPIGGSATHPVVVVNGGPCSPLSITGATPPAGYAISPNIFPISVAPGDSQLFSVTFSPTASGTFGGDVVFTHNSTLPPSPTLLPVTGTGFVQTGFGVPITVSDGVNTQTLHFGILSGASFCIVPWDSVNGHMEGPPPPIPPTGIFDARFMCPRISGCDSLCFPGSLNDFRPFINSIQRDTFNVRSQLGVGSFLTFCWPSGLSKYFTELSFCNTNMLTDTCVTGCDGGPIFSGGLVVGVSEDAGGQLPGSIILHQNYPNPFNPTTNIEFQIPKSEFVSLKVFDVLGRMVQTLVNAKKEPGTHRVQFNAEGLPSGVYFYRLTAGEFVHTRKLMILK